MKLYFELLKYPVFTMEYVSQYYDNIESARSAVKRLIKSGLVVKISFLNKSTQKHNNSMDCQPYAKHRFRQKSERCFCISSGHRDQK